ncbi:MAG: DUF4159 domain-containing protein [Pirellulales bacterium]
MWNFTTPSISRIELARRLVAAVASSWPRRAPLARTATVVGIVALVAGGLACPAPARADVAADQVRQSIERAIGYLKREQREDGTWPDWQTNAGGMTSLCTLALLNAGVPTTDETIQRALKYLRKMPPEWTYAAALQTMVFCAAEPQADAARIQALARWFEDTQIKIGANRGAWSYPRAMGDNSNTQFAMLALYEAERAGARVNTETWRMSLGYWKGCQNADGSWGYQPGNPGTGSMTCAGITSYIIASGQLYPGDATVEKDQVQCCEDHGRDRTLDRALGWLGDNFSVHNNPGRGDAWLFYYLYGVERVGRMTARRFIGAHDWYREGTDMFVRAQDELSGFWRGGGAGENNSFVSTSMALLFLAKGRRPILASKLKHDPADDWERHRSDFWNLTTYVEGKWKRDLTWQIVDSKAATVDDLLQAPVLYISGREAAKFSDDEAGKLREYLDQGGFVFADACCNGKGFDESFRALMKRVFPEPEYEMKLLPPEHPVWRAEEPINPAHVRPLWGINVGCRTSVIYCPDNLSCYWELARPGRDKDYSPEVKQRIAGALSLGINVLAYATNRELKFKYEVPAAVTGRSKEDRFERAKLYMAKLKHTGGADAAPRALVNLQAAIERETGLRVSTDRRDVAIADDELFEYPIVYLHGRNNFHLSDAERKQLRTYVERGGVILGDSICASEAFTRSFREEMAAIFPGQGLERIPNDHPMFGPQYGGFDVRQLKRRDPRRGGGAGPLEARVRDVEPELDGIKIKERFAVIFSPYDLSCALEHQESLDCQGYVRDDAAQLAINLVLYAVHE